MEQRVGGQRERAVAQGTEAHEAWLLGQADAECAVLFGSYAGDDGGVGLCEEHDVGKGYGLVLYVGHGAAACLLGKGCCCREEQETVCGECFLK